MSLILSEMQGHVLLLTLNRPEKMNAYNVDLHHALFAAIDAGDKDPNVRVIVITGAGRAFCAGADISQGFGGAGLTDDLPKIDGVPRDAGGMLNLRIYECDTPIIAAVNGAAIGIGATMLLPMDIKIVSAKAKFAFPFGRRGIVFDGAASWFLPRIVGMSKAQEWILKGDIITPEAALAAGMISEIVEPDQVLSRALDLAHDIAVNVAPESAALNKRLMREGLMGPTGSEDMDAPMHAHMAESTHLQERFASADCAEGVQSFLEKRPPAFKNRR